jgi:hypothetical protein
VDDVLRNTFEDIVRTAVLTAIKGKSGAIEEAMEEIEMVLTSGRYAIVTTEQAEAAAAGLKLRELMPSVYEVMMLWTGTSSGDDGPWPYVMCSSCGEVVDARGSILRTDHGWMCSVCDVHRRQVEAGADGDA